MSSDERAGKQLAALLGAAGEQDIRRRLANLLAELGAGDYALEVRAGTGAADLVCHEYRVVIETKARGEAGPERLRSGASETQHGQVARYVDAFADRRLDLGGERPWRGFLTDGRVWWGWEWRAAAAGVASGAGGLVALPHVQGVVVADDVEAFGQFVVEHLAPPERRGAPAPPSPLRTLFDPFLAELRALLPTVETEPFYETKFGLWRRTLQGSGLVGPGAIGQAHNFAEHTMLVVAARMIVLAAQDDSTIDELPEAVADGFCAWLGDFDAGVDLLERLAGSVSQYDWRAADRDLLKELYHDLIDRDDRKEFGEYYTPDWLADDVVDQVLVKDPARLDAAIEAAAQTLEAVSRLPTQRRRLRSRFWTRHAVLARFCSGLLRAVAKRIRAAHPLLAGRTREIVAAMVTGLDVHPVAVEMAKATLATALPPGGMVPLRVYLADALLHSEQAQQNMQGTLGLTSAQGQRIDIPAEVIESPHAEVLVRTLVDAAVGERSLDAADAETRALLSEAVAQLSDAVADEGDHVWRWYIGNQVAPSALARNKVMAIVANPPWLVANDTPAGTRKDRAGERSASATGCGRRASWSAKGDLASVFSARAADLYLEDGGAFGLVLPGSALISQTWKSWRSGNWGDTKAGFDYVASLDDVEPPPFRHAPNGTCVVVGRRLGDGAAAEWQDAMLLRYSGDPEAPTVTEIVRRESKPSPYAPRFRRGAVASPLGLCLALDPIQPDDNDTATVQTKASTKPPWKGVTYEAVVETAGTRQDAARADARAVRVLARRLAHRAARRGPPIGHGTERRRVPVVAAAHPRLLGYRRSPLRTRPRQVGRGDPVGQRRLPAHAHKPARSRIVRAAVQGLLQQVRRLAASLPRTGRPRRRRQVLLVRRCLARRSAVPHRRAQRRLPARRMAGIKNLQAPLRHQPPQARPRARLRPRLRAPRTNRGRRPTSRTAAHSATHRSDRRRGRDAPRLRNPQPISVSGSDERDLYGRTDS